MSDREILSEPAPASSMTHSPELGELGAALALAQAEIVGAKKDSANPFFKSHYAGLDSVWDACRKPLTKNGLCVIQMPITNGSVAVTTMLLHKSGQWIASTCEADPKDKGPQAIGSVITYLRRYALAAFAGVPQIDDDAETGEARPHEQAHDTLMGKPFTPPTTATRTDAKGGAVITDAQRRRLFAICKQHGYPDEVVREELARMGYQHSNEIKVAHYDDVVAYFSTPYQPPLMGRAS